MYYSLDRIEELKDKIGYNDKIINGLAYELFSCENYKNLLETQREFLVRHLEARYYLDRPYPKKELSTSKKTKKRNNTRKLF